MMSAPRRLLRQQLGFEKWSNYDVSLRRLQCSADEEFRSIWGSNDEDVETPVFACKFSRKKGYENLIALANEDGHLVIHDTDKKEPRNGKQLHHNAIFDIDWLCDSFKIITVSGDHTVRLVDVGNGDVQMEHMFAGHTRSVKTVAVRSDDPSTFATGSRDGSIRVWDTRCSEANNLIMSADRTIYNSHCRSTPSSGGKRTNSVSAANSVTGLVFQDEHTLISCGSGDGLIKVWDLRKSYIIGKREPAARNVIPYSGLTTRNGFSSLMIDQSGVRLYANCLDSTIYCYNISSYNVNPVMEYRGHENSTFYIKAVVSPCGQYILSGSSDNDAYIWNVKNSEPIISLQGHYAEVTCVAWKPSKDLTLVTCSDDVHHKIWRMGSEILPDDYHTSIRGRAELVTPKRIKRHLEINENTPVSTKRQRTDSAKRRNSDSDTPNKKLNTGRRLFDLTNTPSTSGEALAAILEEDECTAAKRARFTFSPTSNLPNFVVDGSAPHLHFSPQKRRDKDWLTKIRVEKSLIKEMQDLSSGGSRLHEESPRTSSAKKPKRRKSTSCSSPRSPLLRYFKVTNNSILKDLPCAPKSSLMLQPSCSSTNGQKGINSHIIDA